MRAPLPEADDPAPALFPSRPLDGPARKLAVLPRLARLLARESLALRRLRPDLIHVHDEPSLYVYGLAARGLSPRPRVLWHLHAEPGRGWILRLRTRLADACLVISPHVTPPPGLPWHLVRNPLPRLSEIPGVAPNLAHIAVVGALGPRKGQDLAVEALALLRRMPGGETARLTLIGPELDPAFTAALRGRIQALGLGDAVSFTGPRPTEAAFAGVGIALFPSRAEIQPLALAEALARGLPVVASDIPAHRAMLADAGADLDRASTLAPDALAQALLTVPRIIAPDHAIRIQTLFDPDRFATELREAIRTLTPPAHGSRL
ncbi:D-inositol-3-phosphate glycosyltransferase [Methylobacterium trifolii]|uniref:D-inositol-3-phosphate glycosyltransferase n=1 Tax=Methylobacterium trifolii TaxID=1003092 RepID=A0ABQ4U948_9HYPH|nr:D-inositol-3-phosphate glycosyltransferase [Methylobacterium trifolii]